jgi:uncharacterized protein
MQQRRIWKKLATEIHTDEVVVITGPRQVGKTTTLKWLLDKIPSQNKLYFDLENLIDRELFETKNYEVLLQAFQNRGLSLSEKIYIGLDEIQLLENLPSVVKYLYDHHQIKFFLTGSSSYYIKNRFSESMAGRKVIYEMFPLSFQEFIDFRGFAYSTESEEFFHFIEFSDPAYQQLKDYYQEYIEFGGLPKVVLTTDEDRKRQLLEEIFSSYINIDVQALADFKSTTDLRKVIKLLAARVGSRLNVSEIASITGLTRVTVDNYIQFLEQTYLIRTIPAFSRSTDVQTRLQRKPYFIDTGIANVNADLSSGSKFENTICHQLTFWDGSLSYFDDRDGEIDFIVNNKGKLGAFEVKETATETDYKTLVRRAEKLGITKCRVVGRVPSATFINFLWGGFIK